MSKKDKVQKIKVHIRRLWPKYDQNLDQLINTKPEIIKILNAAFNDAGLGKDFDHLTQHSEGLNKETIEELIY